MTRFPLRYIHERVSERPPGYLSEVLTLGRIDGDHIEFEDAIYDDLVKKYRGAPIRYSLAQKLANFAGTVGEWRKAGLPVVDQATLEARATRCFSCPHWLAQRFFPHCEICGCLELKHELLTASCPIGRWAFNGGLNGHSIRPES